MSFNLEFTSLAKKYVLLQKMSVRNKVHNISAMGIQTQDRWIVLVLIYESGIQVLDQNKTKAVEFPLRDALIVHTDQKLMKINSINFCIEIVNNKARHNLINAKCRWRSDQLDGAGSFREPFGQTKVMQICQGETLDHQGAITHELCCLVSIVKKF